MKQGLNFHLPVNVEIDLSTVEKIEFVFSRAEGATVLKKEVYPGTVRLKEPENIFLIPFTSAETYQFENQFYMDTRITLKGTKDQPETPIIPLIMNDTLFEKDDEYVN